MKFFGKKSLSSLLYWLCRAFVIGQALLFIFILVSIVFENYTINSSNEFGIEIPLTDSFIMGNYTEITFSFLVISMSISLLYYGVFFYLLQSIFKAFSLEKVIFTKKTIDYIKKFAWLNILLPPLGIIAAYFIKSGIDFETIMQGGLLVLLGIFALFVVAVFNEGILLQEENELTI